MPERRPTVMISSTARDLPKHREQARLGCHRAGFSSDQMMENLTALDENAVTVSLKMVEEADIYVGIFAHRYGYVPKGSDISITEMEYDKAVELEKPRLIFFADKAHPWTEDDWEIGEGAIRLKAFKERVGTELVAAFFKSPEDLRGHVGEALAQLRRKLEGDAASDPKEAAQRLHRRTAIPAPPEPYIAHPYTLSQTRDLVGRQNELNALTDWVTKPDSPAGDAAIFCIVAIGGMGKSALTWKFRDIAPEEIPDLAGRLWWSFYESDASFENFLNRALCYVGGLSEDDVRKMDRHDRETALLRHLDEKPYLLVLDGLERILLAYNRMDASSLADEEYDEQTANVVAGAYGLPASAAQSFTGQPRLRQATDPRAGQFLRKLAQIRKSRVLVSTRLYPLALQLVNRSPCPGCSAYFLKGLSDDDAVILWRQLGVSGSRQELLPLFRSFESHPLLVQALAGEIAPDRRAPGDFIAWRENNPSFDPASLQPTQVKSHILQHALAGLDEAARETLNSVTALRTPATYDTLDALLVGDGKAFGQHQALDRALTELEDRGLIGWDREANRYDAHPIVRGVVWQLAGGEARDAVHAAIDAHFEPMAVPEWEQVESLADLTPAIERYHTLVERGLFDDACDLFKDRLAYATYYRLAAFRDHSAMLERLFPNGTDKLPTLKSKEAQAWTLFMLAMSYDSSGRPGQAVVHYQQVSAITDELENLQILLSNQALALRETGAIRNAEGLLRQALNLSRELESTFQEAVSLCEFGRIAATVADRKSARNALARSGIIHKKESQGVISAYLAELSLWKGDVTAAGRWADGAWQLASVARLEREFIRAALLQGRAAFERGDQEQAEERLYHALARARAVNVVELELPALIAIGALELARGKPGAARERLDEIWEPAEEGPYPLYQADAYNVLAEICRAEGDEAGAIEAATKAYRAAWCDGPP
ncbi:MAG: DUF4062 domain-containing protein [Alphaproteobacteria bacterium]|nr:DUF4062 domain-containing protein [Alphaproteobacteria bacterium]